MIATKVQILKYAVTNTPDKPLPPMVEIDYRVVPVEPNGKDGKPLKVERVVIPQLFVRPLEAITGRP